MRRLPSCHTLSPPPAGGRASTQRTDRQCLCPPWSKSLGQDRQYLLTTDCRRIPIDDVTASATYLKICGQDAPLPLPKSDLAHWPSVRSVRPSPGVAP